MDFNRFNNILEHEGIKLALKYKSQYIPKKLFQYNTLLDDKYTCYIEKNALRLKALEKNEIYVSNYKNFNDPFEFEMLSLDVKKLKDENYNINEIEKFLDEFKNKILVCCFTTIKDNMPMWAHYANNHKGYCVEYRINNADKIYPVFYENSRNSNSEELTNMIKELYNYYNDIYKHKEEFCKIFSYFYLSLCCKNKFWKYENEYRLLYKREDNKDIRGKTIKIEDEGINIESIYIGYNCEGNYIKSLINIAKKLKCNVYKMDFDKYGVNYKLISEKINYY